MQQAGYFSEMAQKEIIRLLTFNYQHNNISQALIFLSMPDR